MKASPGTRVNNTNTQAYKHYRLFKTHIETELGIKFNLVSCKEDHPSIQHLMKYKNFVCNVCYILDQTCSDIPGLSEQIMLNTERQRTE